MTWIYLLSSTHPRIVKEGILKTEVKKETSYCCCLNTYYIIITYNYITKPIILRYNNSIESQIDLNTIRIETRPSPLE